MEISTIITSFPLTVFSSFTVHLIRTFLYFVHVCLACFTFLSCYMSQVISSTTNIYCIAKYVSLSDLRFLSIDFLNTFLLTYKVFTDGIKVLTALKRVYYASVEKEKERMAEAEYMHYKEENTLQIYEDYRRRSSLLQFTPRRTSGASSVSGYCSESSDRDRSLSYDSQGQRIFRSVLISKCELNVLLFQYCIRFCNGKCNDNYAKTIIVL